MCQFTCTLEEKVPAAHGKVSGRCVPEAGEGWRRQAGREELCWNRGRPTTFQSNAPDSRVAPRGPLSKGRIWEQGSQTERERKESLLDLPGGRMPSFLRGQHWCGSAGPPDEPCAAYPAFRHAREGEVPGGRQNVHANADFKKQKVLKGILVISVFFF